MNRADLQGLSEARIREAKLLFEAGEYSGAYYLAGYAIECALKACFAKSVQQYDFPDKSSASKVFTHRMTDLARLANLEEDLAAERERNPKFLAGWDMVCKWTEDSRYETQTKNKAEAIIDAIDRNEGGVLPWIKLRW
jgi:HEPN domain-containing protein